MKAGNGIVYYLTAAEIASSGAGLSGGIIYEVNTSGIPTGNIYTAGAAGVNPEILATEAVVNSSITNSGLPSYYIAASQAAMLALTAKKGDWCNRTDLTVDTRFLLTGANAATLGNWVQWTDDFTSAMATKLDGIAAGATANVVENILTSTSTVNALSAAQGKALQDNKAALASSGTPVMDGTAALGAGTTAAKSDHIHPSDTSRATSSHIHSDGTTTVAGFISTTDKTKLDGVTSGATNTPLSSTNPIMDGTVAIGIGTTASRADHVHASDTSKAGTAVATTSVNGIMSATDKTKLDGVATGATANVVNNTLTSVSTTEALSAAQGKTLKDTADTLATTVGGKQATLVSGTTIKTLNSTSLLGAGDIAITQTITNTIAPILTGSTVVTALAVLATTDWDKQIPVDATTGNITIQLPTAVGNSGKSIRMVRLDSSINTVTVYARYDEGIGGIQTGADAIGIKATGSITIKSNGTQPVLAAWENPASVSRLWLPNDLAGQVGWYRPDGLSAGSMATWTDAFGFNNITATGTAPTVATGGQNGYAKIGFNGASNMLSVGSVNLDTLTIMGIFTPVAAAYHNILRGNNTNGFSLGSNNNNPMTIVMGQRGVVNFTASTATWAIGSPALFGATYDAAGVYTYYKDGANGGTATDNRLMATQPMDIASNTNMDYYEQIIYTTVQVAADIDRLNGYLAHKYSLTANLAGGHTYKTLPPLVSLATY